MFKWKGNKRIATACFLHFMEQNNALYYTDGTPIINNASWTNRI
jgi:hypothetical protein